MIIKFTETELKQISIQQVERRRLSEAYREEREQVWQKTLARAQATRKTLWNGEIYTIEEIMQYDETRIVIQMSTCEYKDIVFRVEKGVEAIATRYDIRHIPKWITVDCIPITKEGKFVFGIRSDGTIAKAGVLGLIGGTVNKDEMPITNIGDIGAFMRREIQEETNIPCTTESLKLFSLNFFYGKYQFLFTVSLPNRADEVEALGKEGEFTRLIPLSLEEVLSIPHSGLDAFRYCKNYLHLLPSVL